jgi:hypothetical protein
MLSDSAYVKQKKRHGCLTTWLVLIIVFNAIAIIIAMPKGSPSVEDLPWWQAIIAIIFSLVNIGFAIGLFMWKKWAFWGFCASAIVSLVSNIVMGQLVILAIVSFVVELGVLSFVINIGGENKGWDQLE